MSPRAASALLLLTLLAAGMGCHATRPLPVPVDDGLRQRLGPTELLEVTRQELYEHRPINESLVAYWCRFDLEQGLLRLGDGMRWEHVIVPLEEAAIHIRAGKTRSYPTLTRRGDDISSTTLCYLGASPLSDPPTAGQLLALGRLVSALAAHGVEVPSRYRSELLQNAVQLGGR